MKKNDHAEVLMYSLKNAPLLAVLARQCAPAKCTAARLVKQRIVREARAPPRGSVVLHPYSERCISREDCDAARKKGLVALDYSWNEVRDDFPTPRGCIARRLPFLVAANPTHYGRPRELSSAEALAAALWIMGFDEEARRVMSPFKWGETFLTINMEMLDGYAEAKDAEGVAEMERMILEHIQAGA